MEYADFLKTIVQAMVGNPAGVRISQSETLNEGHNTAVLQLVISCDKADVARVIGKEGKTIAAIRRVMTCLNDSPYIQVKVNDPLGPRARPRFAPKPAQVDADSAMREAMTA